MSAWVVPGYTESRQLGQGASGRVVAAVHDDSGTPVAIKYLSPKLFRDPAFLHAFREEAELLRSLDVPDVVRIYDYVEAPGEGAAIVMELIEGVSLYQMISRQGATSPESALAVLKGSLLGLAAAHSLGIVHRDYKPENVLVDGDGRSKLSDFGVAVRAGKDAPAAGTPLYMAPEQWAGGPATPATDIYAASAVFFECLTSRAPFSGRLDQLAHQHETAAVPLMEVDQPVQRLIGQGMAKDPRDRPVNAIAFIEELDWVAERAYGPDWERRGRSQLAGRAAALLALLFGAGVVAGGAGAALAASSLGGRSFLGSLFGGRLFPARTAAGGLTIGTLAGSKAAIAVTAGVVGVAAIGGTTFVLVGNHGNTTTTASGPSAPGASSTGTGDPSGALPFGGSATPAASPTPTTTPSASATPSATPAAAPTTTAPATPAPTTTAPTTKPPTTKPPTTKPPTTKPPTTKPPTTAAPNISVNLSSNPASPDALTTCDTTAPTFTVTAVISSNVAATITYTWSGSATGSGMTTVVANGSQTVSITVPAATQFSGSETLTVNSPVTASNTLSLSVTCPAIQ
jgi:tRNA A-37 threonylcarbamoyl transferase component Bud32